MRVGILGGTFDPPHAGHLGVGVVALESGFVDEVWLVPCLTHRFAKQPVSFEHRLEMCRLLIGSRAGLHVSDMESKLDKPGHTLDLVLAFKALHPDYQFRLIAGTDIYHQRHQWHQYDEIARLAPPLYVGRVGEEPIPEKTLPAPPDVSSTDLRKLLLAGGREIDHVPDDIARYIEEHGLYKD